MPQNILTFLLGSKHEKDLRELVPLVQRINALEPEVKALADADFPGRTARFRERIADGEQLDAILPEAYALAREAARRKLGERLFDVQLMGGDRPAQGQDRRDEDRRGQDPRERARRLPQQPHGQGRARHHGERLPRRARRGVDGTDLCPARGLRRGHSQPDGQRAAQAGLRPRHHLRHEQRVRLRLPARQHVLEHGREGPARPRLRHRRRDRQHPHRRGAHPPHHLGHGRGRHCQVRRGEQAGRAPRGVREGPRHGRLPRGHGGFRRATSSWRRRTSGSPSPTRA